LIRLADAFVEVFNTDITRPLCGHLGRRGCRSARVAALRMTEMIMQCFLEVIPKTLPSAIKWYTIEGGLVPQTGFAMVHNLGPRVIVMALAQEATESDDDNDNPDLDDFHKKVSKKVRKVLENARDPKHPVILAETQLGVNPP
jgi:hypothetical protein